MSRFSFLSRVDQELTDLLVDAETSFAAGRFSHGGLDVRRFLERMTKKVDAAHGVPDPSDVSLEAQINRQFDAGRFPENIKNKMHRVRQLANNLVHDNIAGTPKHGGILLDHCHGIAAWYSENFHPQQTNDERIDNSAGSSTKSKSFEPSSAGSSFRSAAENTARQYRTNAARQQYNPNLDAPRYSNEAGNSSSRKILARSALAFVGLVVVVWFFRSSPPQPAVPPPDPSPFEIAKYLRSEDLAAGYSISNGQFYSFDLPEGTTEVFVTSGTVALTDADRRLTRQCSSASFSVDSYPHVRMPLVASCDHRAATLRATFPSSPPLPVPSPTFVPPPQPVNPAPPPPQQFIQVRNVGFSYAILPGISYGLALVPGITFFDILSGAVVITNSRGQLQRGCSSLGFNITIANPVLPANDYVTACGSGPASIRIASINGVSTHQQTATAPQRYHSVPGIGDWTSPGNANSRYRSVPGIGN